jgi:general secretion pathway protein L
MSEFVVIRLAAENQPVQWLTADSTGALRTRMSTGSLEQAAQEVAGRNVIVLVPSMDVLTTTVKMPVRSASKVRAALPFALEEDLADDVDDLHFASGKRLENGRMQVAIVATAAIDAWLQRLQAAGIEAQKLVPEVYGLASIPNSMSLLVDGPLVMYNDGAETEFVMQDMKPSDLLVAAGKLGDETDEEDNAAHLLVFCDAQKEQELSHDWVALRHELGSVDVNVLRDSVTAKLAVTVAAGNGVNLLQGAYGKKAEYSLLFRPWKTAAALLLGLALLGLVAKGADYQRLVREDAALRSQFASVYQSIRPGDGREILDPANTVQSLRRSLGPTAGPQIFLPSMSELASAVAANSSATIDGISYRAGVIDIRLTTPDVETLDNIQKAISASGRFSAKIQATDQIADKTSGRLQIRETG